MAVRAAFRQWEILTDIITSTFTFSCPLSITDLRSDSISALRLARSGVMKCSIAHRQSVSPLLQLSCWPFTDTDRRFVAAGIMVFTPIRRYTRRRERDSLFSRHFKTKVNGDSAFLLDFPCRCKSRWHASHSYYLLIHVKFPWICQLESLYIIKWQLSRWHSGDY